MKKILILALTALSLSASAQKIAYDEVKNGARIIGTEETICRSMTDRLVLAVSLGAIIDEAKGDTMLTLDTHITGGVQLEVAKGAPMLIKLMDDTVIELAAAAGDKETVRDIHVVNGAVSHSYDIRPAFQITREQIEAIATKKVKKVRIDVSPQMYDKEFKKDKIGAAIAAQWAVLLDAVNKPAKSFSDGF